MASLDSPDINSPEMAEAERASGSSFYTAMRILPRAQREAMFEIYSFCRQVDDIADSNGPRDERRRAPGSPRLRGGLEDVHPRRLTQPAATWGCPFRAHLD